VGDEKKEDTPGPKKNKHFSAFQNKPLEYEEVSPFLNKIMLAIDVPRYFDLERKR